MLENQKNLVTFFGLGPALLFGLTITRIKLFLPVYDLLPLAGLFYMGAGLVSLKSSWLQKKRKVSSPSAETPIQKAEFELLGGIILTGGVLAPVLMSHSLRAPTDFSCGRNSSPQSGSTSHYSLGC